MKKIYIVLLWFFCVIHNNLIVSSQEDLANIAISEIQKLSSEDQAKLNRIEAIIKAKKEDELEQADIIFFNSIQIRIQEKLDQFIAQLEQDKIQKSQAKANMQIMLFRSLPQGPCPYTQQDQVLVDILEDIVHLDQEISAHKKEHSGIETMLACNKQSYSAKSIATSPYHALVPLIDGTISSLYQHGKKPFTRKKIEPENEFHIEVIQSQVNPHLYKFTLTAHSVCNNLDLDAKPAHNQLAQRIYEHLRYLNQDNQDVISGYVDGTSYSGYLTACSDAQVKIICHKDVLTYIVKKKNNDMMRQKNKDVEEIKTSVKNIFNDNDKTDQW